MQKLISRLTFVCIALVSWNALSQAWLPDRESREGPGIALGDKLLLHPGAVVEGGYDTNPIRKTKREGAGRLRLSAYADMANRYREAALDDEQENLALLKAKFRLGLAMYYDFFFSKNATIDDQDDLGLNGNLDLVLFPEGVFSLLLKGTYTRSKKPYETPSDRNAYHVIAPMLGVETRPGGGTLTLALHVGVTAMLFEDGLVATRNNKVSFNLAYEARWKMLPKTALVSVIRYNPTRYLGSSEINVDSRPVRGLIGIKGLFTPRFGLSLFAGFGASFYERGDDFEGAIANGELMFFITPSVELTLGASRDFEDSFYANYYVKTGGYAKYSHTIGHIFQISLAGDAYYREYSYLSGRYGSYSPNTDYRIDTWLGATLLLEWRATDWLSALASCVYQGNVSNFAYSSDAAAGTWVDFQEVEIMVGVQARY